MAEKKALAREHKRSLHAAQSLRAVGRLLVVVVVVLTVGVLYSTWRVYALDESSARQIHDAAVRACARTNQRVIVGNRKSESLAAAVRAAAAVATLVRAGQLDPGPQAARELTAISARRFQLMVTEAEVGMPVVDCEREYPLR